jgi:acetyltransferase-like isoleucine patch superfamily enzyme
MIGAGTVVSRNIDKGCFFLGNPGRLINRIELPEEHK